MTETIPALRRCRAVLTVLGERFRCELPAPHPSCSHVNHALRASWVDGDER